MLHIAIVDANRASLEAVERLVDWHTRRFTLAGAFTDATSAREALASAPYDLALVDPTIAAGFDLIRTLSSHRPGAPILAFSTQSDPLTLFDALEAGARGYLLKSTPPERLVDALLDAAAGGAPLSPEVSRVLIEHARRPPGLEHGPSTERLTPRELEVLSELARGATYAETARRLGIGLGTVQSHVKSIYRKLDVASKTQAAAFALARGLVSP